MKKILVTFFCALLFFSCESVGNEVIEDAPPQVSGAIDSESVEPDMLLPEELPESSESEITTEILPESAESEVLPEEFPEPFQIPLDAQNIVEQVAELEVLDNQEISMLSDEIAQTETILDNTPTVLEVIANAVVVEDSPEPSQATEILAESEVLPEEFPESFQLPLDTQSIVEQSVELEVLDNQEVSMLTDEIAQTETIPDDTPTVLEVIANAVVVEDSPEPSQVTEILAESEVLSEELPQIVESPEIIEVPEVLQLPLKSKTELIPEVEVLPPPMESIFEPEPIVPKQTVQINEGQSFDILFLGRGWIYLGEVSATEPPVTSFLRRQTEDANTLFVLHAKNVGSTLLHFYKQDALENGYLDEYIEVVVVAENEQIADPTSVFADGLENAGTSSEPEVSLVELTDNDYPTDEDTNLNELELSMDEVFEQAQVAYNEQRYTDSLKALDTYFEQSVDQLDRAWFLSGQIYEENSDVRNMRKALYAYETLVTFFPDSSLWDEAQKRITYIKRFYFNIR